MSRKNARLSVGILIMGLFLANFAECATFPVSSPAEFQAALTTAQANSEADTINVAAGTYDISSTLSYSTTENFDLTISGAGQVTTILDGGNTVQIMRLSGEGNGDITVSGLTFQHGRMSNIESFGGAFFILNTSAGDTVIDQCVATNSTAIRNAGGAWLGAVNGDITVANSSFTYNSCDVGTSDDGCGLYLYFDTTEAVGNATVRNNIISHNTLNDNPHPVGGCDGAGMMIYHLGTGAFSLTVEDNTISDNSSIHGVAGIVVRNPHLGATLSIIGNTFARNISGGTPYEPHPEIPGGAAHIYSDGGTMIINDNIFLDNEQRGPYDRGAGLCVDNFPSGIFRMANNVFAGNDCSHNGGGAQINLGSGVTSANIVGNLFVNNQANLTDGVGGGLMLNPECDVNLINNTFYGNTAAGAAGLGYYTEGTGRDLIIINDIYRANTPDSISNLGTGTIAATYSNIDGGSGQPYFGTGCIDTDPLFFNVSNPPGADGIYATIDDGLHLTAASPSFNTGSNAAVPAWLTLDIAGQARILGGTVDMGAYEGIAGTPTAYSITMAVAPADSGTTSPAVGTHSVTSPQTIIATAAAGYVFTGWATTAGLTAASPSSSSTSLSFNTDGTATANFALIPATATLTMAVSPAAGGTTNPAIGTHVDQPTQVPINITATAADGYSFVDWTKTGSVTLGSTTQANTTATLLGNAAVTANFALLPETPAMTYGSFITITPDELGMPDGSEFGGKPSPSVAYDDITKTPAARKKAGLTAVFDRNNPDSFDCIWSRKIPLFNKKNILKSQTAEVYIPLVQTINLPFACDLSVKAKDQDRNTETYEYGEINLAPPAITGVFPDSSYTPGTEITSAAAGATVYIEGAYVGTKAPKAWLEYQTQKNGATVVKTKACKVLKPLAFPDYKDKAGTSCMDLTSATGLSRITVQLPRSFPRDWDNVSTSHNIVIDNGIGRATWTFTTD